MNFTSFNFEEITKGELIVMSPGVSAFKFSEFRKPGEKVISEIELAFGFLKEKLIAISGTNGKSTTASLIHHLFKAARRKSYLLGNILMLFINKVESKGADEYSRDIFLKENNFIFSGNSLVSILVIGVPTSVGYGIGAGGIAPLLTMLQSCFQGLAVVNIDNGFSAAALAALIANGVSTFRKKERRR